MTVQLGDNDTTNLDCLVKGLSLLETSLTDRGIHNEDACVRVDGCGDLLHFLEKCNLLFVTTRGIHNDDLILLILKELDTFLGDFNRIGFFLVTEEWALDLSSIHFELLKGASTEGVRAHQANSVTLLHVVIGELGASGGLTGTLKTDEHNHV